MERSPVGLCISHLFLEGVVELEGCLGIDVCEWIVLTSFLALEISSTILAHSTCSGWLAGSFIPEMASADTSPVFGWL